MSHLKAIIFDVDGTIANTEETHRQAFNVAFKEFGLPYEWSEEEYTRQLFISGGKERICSFLVQKDVKQEHDLEYWHEYSLKLHQRKSAIYKEKLEAGHIELRPGIKRLIHEARDNNIKIAIATCTSLSNVETLLKLNLGNDALNLFDAVVTADIVVDKKPSPAVYQFTLAELGLKPGHCIAIEDTLNGNLAALNAGLKTIITTHSYTLDNDFSGASLVLDQLGEPGNYFQVLSGNNFKSQYVDISLMDIILSTHDSTTAWTPELVAVSK